MTFENPHDFLKKCATDGGRIVCTGDLTLLQVSEAQARGNMYVDGFGFGYVILPWDLTTKMDREREQRYAGSAGEKHGS